MISKRTTTYYMGSLLITGIGVYTSFVLNLAVALMYITIASFILWVYNVERAKYDLLTEEN